MLIADNVQWDTAGKFDAILDAYLAFVDDEKPITVRQCVQSLARIVPHKQHLISRIQAKLLAVDLSSRKDTQRKIYIDGYPIRLRRSAPFSKGRKGGGVYCHSPDRRDCSIKKRKQKSKSF